MGSGGSESGLSAGKGGTSSKKTITTEELKSLLDRISEESEYSYIGVRTQEEPFTLGDIDHVSSVWDNGEESGEYLDGISCTNANSPAIRMHCGDHGSSFYYGKHLAILGSNDVTYGEDVGELIMKDARVIYIIK